MSLNGGRNVSGKVRIDGCSRVCRKQSNAFGDRAGRGFCRLKNRHRPRSTLDNDLRASPHTRQKRGHTGSGGFLFGNVDDVLTHDGIIHRDASVPALDLILNFYTSVCIVTVQAFACRSMTFFFPFATLIVYCSQGQDGMASPLRWGTIFLLFSQSHFTIRASMHVPT